MSEPVRIDAGDEVQVAKRRSKAQRIQDRKEKAIAEVMGTQAGRIVLWDIWEQGRVFQTLFALDPYQHAFNAGNQHPGKTLLDDVMRLCPDKFVLAMNEAKQKEDENV